ncbi:MAG: DMT family transporter [Devosia sp.]|nr:DMT family transporter [Devosia sp.]
MAAAVKPIEDRRLLGIGLVLFGYLTFAIIDSCAKWMMQRGIPPMEVVFIRYFGQFVLVLALLAPQTGPVAMVRSRRIGLEIIRALCLLGSTVANFIAITYIPLTVTGSINFTAPLVVCALSVPLLGEHVGWRRWLAILVGFAGVLIIVRPGTAEFHPAMLLSVLCVLFTSTYFILTRKLAGVDGSATQQFYAAGVSTLCLVPFAFGGWVWPSSLETWIPFIAIGTFAMIGHQAVTVAHRFAPASVLAPFNYVLIVYLTASSWLVFNQPPDASIFIGAPIVIASGLYIWMRERQLARSVVAKPVRQD